MTLNKIFHSFLILMLISIFNKAYTTGIPGEEDEALSQRTGVNNIPLPEPTMSSHTQNAANLVYAVVASTKDNPSAYAEFVEGFNTFANQLEFATASPYLPNNEDRERAVEEILMSIVSP
jgi:hypothetical protein